MKKITNLLNEKYDNHIFPFLWMHGEDKETIQTYISKIYEAGIRSVCIESRPHEEFLKAQWWDELAIIIEECEKRQMTLWILDDKHFPTGYAAGEIEKNHRHLQKEFLNFRQFDFVGPKKNAGIMLDWCFNAERPNILNSERETVKESGKSFFSAEIISAVAVKKTGFKQISEENWIDLTDSIIDETLYWSIPEGEWSIFVFYTTQEGGEASTQGYLNPLVPEATDILLETVYQSHYQHFGEKFGTTIQGFFSDEPRFGNIKGPDAVLGKVDMPLPWRHDLLTLLANQLAISETELRGLLPALYRGESKHTAKIRYNYMSLVSELYSQHFSQRIGRWCREHKVDYIGHVIEDNNAHARLGYGAGHFFQSMKGQSMAGIDVVLHQLMPQQNDGYFEAMTSTGWDGEFFHYALGKMGASLGNLDPVKQGRTMCEVFGAYGWSEGTKLMKWLTDHMLVRGVNHFVPHAFSMNDFPDADCPPHFYAQGHNPQFEGFKQLMAYMNRLSYLFSDGKHQADIAVLYHAEAEWAGAYMPIQKVARELMEHQYEFEIVSVEMMLDAQYTNQTFVINEHAFQTLVIPYAERMSDSLIKKLTALAESGIQIIFIEEMVKESLEETLLSHELRLLDRLTEVTPLTALTDNAGLKVRDRLETSKALPYLRYYHYQQQTDEVFMLFNENDSESLQFQAVFPAEKPLVQYDPVENKLKPVSYKNGSYEIHLVPAESLILFEATSEQPLRIETSKPMKEVHLNDQPWQVTFEGIGKEQAAVTCQKQYSSLPLLGVGDDFSRFSGKITYTVDFPKAAGEVLLSIEDASEVVTVSVNGHCVGTRISTPYTFELTDLLRKTNNSIQIEVINNLGRSMRDYLSQFVLFEPLGITGEIKLFIEEEQK
ncbi:hypothetical protein IGI84_002311 [Enterococcus sp. DIV0008]|uniref:glycosyl hydrolase n=1 Tax=unclassified Enterococcus TaxID=2608891 RepID=UPI00216773E6